MRISFSVGRSVRAGKLLGTIIASVFLWACSGSDGNSDASANATPATPSNPATPGAKANTVSASVEESGDVVAYVGKSASITVDFTTAGGIAKSLKLAPPADAGWQSADGKLGCDSVSSDQPCKLRLRYAPNAPAASAALKLSYGYVDSAGNARSDSFSVNYRALAANAATATVDPAGTVNAVVGVASAVTVSFGTNDGSAASALHADLAALPAGWSGNASVFDCASFGGNACQLQLVYQPTASAAPSSFDLPYSYVDSAGDAQAGKLTIAYAATGPNSVFASVLPASRVAVALGASRDVTLSFLPSDGRLASAVKLADGVTLPEGWSIKSSTLPCATVSADGQCQLVLTFSPTASLPTQALDLGFDYVNAIGQAQHGTASVSYSSRIYSAYVADFYAGSASAGGGLLQCEAETDGSLQNCAKVASAWPAISTNRVIVSGSRAYVTTNLPSTLGTRALSVCDVDIDGSLINCANAGASFDGILSFAVTGQYAYLISPISSSAGSLNRITRCTLDGRGQVPQDSCVQLPFEATGTVVPSALVAFKSAVYVAAAVDTTDTGARLLRCVPSPTDATQTACQTFTATYPQSVQGLAGASLASGDYLYLLSANNSVSPGTGAIVKCTLAPDGSISGCDGGKLPGGVPATDLALSGDIAIAGKLAYITVTQGNLKGILSCPIDDATGDLGACVSAGDTGANTPFDITLR